MIVVVAIIPPQNNHLSCRKKREKIFINSAQQLLLQIEMELENHCNNIISVSRQQPQPAAHFL